MNSKSKALYLSQLALFSALIIVMSIIPFLGYIPLGFMNATIIHIPVILGGILLGTKAGAILGGVFGITSIVRATLQPNITSFVFTPFFTLGDGGGNYMSLIVSLVPRILIGVVASLVFALISRKIKSTVVASAVTGVCGALTNTLLVMSGIFLFFGPDYAKANGLVIDELFPFIAGIIGSIGIIEAIVSGIICALIIPTLLKIAPRLRVKG